MSWLGEGLSTFTSFTKEVLTESREEVNDHVAELTVARQKMRQLEGQYSAQRQEVDRLRRVNGESDEKIQVLELQLRNLAADYRSVLQQKQIRIEQLNVKLEELEERNAKFSPTAEPQPTDDCHLSLSPFKGDAHDFDDVISCQREINRLSNELRRLRADKVTPASKQLTMADGGARVEDLEDLRAKVQALEAGHQRELSALEELHHRQVCIYEQELSRVHQSVEAAALAKAKLLGEETQSEESQPPGDGQSGESKVSDKAVQVTREEPQDPEDREDELRRLNVRLKELEQVLALAEAQRTQNAKNRTDDHKEVAALQKQLGALHDEHQRALGEAVDAQNRCKLLQEQVTTLTARLQNLNRQDGDTEADRERLVTVLNEKARENSGLRAEVHRLTGVVAKLQRLHPPEVLGTAPDGTVERLRRALREKDLDVQALSDKNRALLEVLRKATPAEEVGRTEGLLADRADLVRKAESLEEDAAKSAEALSREAEKHDALRQSYDELSLRFEGQRRTLEEALEVEAALRGRMAALERESPPGEVTRLRMEVERLRAHLVQVEESYTAEALEAERREEDLRGKLAKAEQRSKMEQVRALTLQRDEALGQLSVREDEAAQLAASLRTLQVVLQQLQQEKEREASALKSKASADLAREKRAISDLQREKRHLEERLSEAAEALEAASRLSEQLDKKDETLSALQDQVAIKDAEVSKAHEELERLRGSTDSMVDKAIVRNLLVGFFGVSFNQRQDVLRVMATVLDLSPEERSKVGLETAVIAQPTAGGSWMPSFLRRTPSVPSGAVAVNKQPSLSEAFVRFLELESAPTPMVKMAVPVMRSAARTNPLQSSSSLASASGVGNNLLMRPMATALPTFTPVMESSSAGPNLLRSVLQQN